MRILRTRSSLFSQTYIGIQPDYGVVWTCIMTSVPSIPSASVEARLEIPEGVCVLTYEKLDTQAIIQSVADDGAGATAVFIGTTRNSFKGETPTMYTVRVLL